MFDPPSAASLFRVFSDDQRAAVTAAFRTAGYDGVLKIAPVIGEDERVFLLDSEAFGALRDKTNLEMVVLQAALRRKVWVIERTAQWPTALPFE